MSKSDEGRHSFDGNTVDDGMRATLNQIEVGALLSPNREDVINQVPDNNHNVLPNQESNNDEIFNNAHAKCKQMYDERGQQSNILQIIELS